eukprot:357218-Chlamydomonas_euryale.AAC.20
MAPSQSRRCSERLSAALHHPSPTSQDMRFGRAAASDVPLLLWPTCTSDWKQWASFTHIRSCNHSACRQSQGHRYQVPYRFAACTPSFLHPGLETAHN